MVSLYSLVMNECIKIVKKKRLLVVLVILAALISMFAYAQMRIAEDVRAQIGTDDWRAELRQQIADNQRSLSSGRMPDSWQQMRQIEIEQLQYYLDKDVNPSSPNGVTFTRDFLRNATILLIPLMVMVIAADLVSGEHAAGTIKLLLTRPVRRWKVLLSKYISLLLFISFTVVAAGMIAYLISGAIFGYGGWDMPVFTGFRVTGAEVDFSYVRSVNQWFYLLMELGLVWFAAVIVGIITLMVSVLVRSTAAGMGIMLAMLISGTILTNMASSWETAKYLFIVNLRLTDYLSGAITPIEGMNLPFSLSVLTIWGTLSVVVAFVVFTRKDILN